MCCEPAASGRRCRKANSGAAVRFISIFWTGKPSVYLCSYGKAACGNTMKWKALPGNGKVWMGRWSRRLWHWNPLAETRRIGEKKGSKRSLLTDQKGVPLSIVLSGANTHDVKLGVFQDSCRCAKKAKQLGGCEPCCTSDEGGPLGVADQAEMPNHPKLHP